MTTINRNARDRLFKALFGSNERKDLTLELYNAINHTNYTNPDDIQINTLEDVVYGNEERCLFSASGPHESV